MEPNIRSSNSCCSLIPSSLSLYLLQIGKLIICSLPLQNNCTGPLLAIQWRHSLLSEVCQSVYLSLVTIYCHLLSASKWISSWRTLSAVHLLVVLVRMDRPASDRSTRPYWAIGSWMTEFFLFISWWPSPPVTLWSPAIRWDCEVGECWTDALTRCPRWSALKIRRSCATHCRIQRPVMPRRSNPRALCISAGARSPWFNVAVDRVDGLVTLFFYYSVYLRQRRLRHNSNCNVPIRLF